MRRVACLLVAVLFGLSSLAITRDVAASQWGSSYGDPYGFCPNGSFLPSTYTTVVTNDPEVGSNPEQNTFWGIHANPGYDDWYGHWYGDFAGLPGDDSGWHHIGTSYYGQPPLYWNFASYGWSVHGHAKQYIAYYNWTFGGQCGYGWYGSWDAPPYMADVYGYPVVDIYVDQVPPAPPVPRATAVTATSVTFTWDPVSDRADGAGGDAWAVGMGTYDSWLTIGGATSQLATTTAPRTLTASGLGPGQTACVDVRAADLLGNSTAPVEACAQTIPPPPVPAAPPASRINLNPPGRGLTGLPTWYWLAPAPATITTYPVAGGYAYRVDQVPTDVAWSFGDGGTVDIAVPAGSGLAYPAPSTVAHTYERYSPGVTVSATVNWTLRWWVQVSGAWLGPYAWTAQAQPLAPVTYAVVQAQAVLTG